MQDYDSQHYIDARNEISSSILKYIDNNTNEEDNFQSIIQVIQKHKIQENSEEFIIFIKLINQISEMHHYSINMYEKLTKILQYVKEDLLKHFTNEEIIQIFANKKILLNLIKENIIKIDKSTAQQIDKLDSKIRDFFYPEIKAFLDDPKEPENMPPDFEEKRKDPFGKDTAIRCYQTDDLDGFISYIEEKKGAITKDSGLAPYFYEYYGYASLEQAALIEFAAYYGSKKIFDYLLKNDYLVRPIAIFYAIRGGNLEIFKKIEEQKLDFPEKDYLDWMNTAIISHENEIATYIKEKYFEKNGDDLSDYIKTMVNVYNYYFIDSNFEFLSFHICYLLEFTKSFNFSRILLKDKKVNINQLVISDSIISNSV